MNYDKDSEIEINLLCILFYSFSLLEFFVFLAYIELDNAYSRDYQVNDVMSVLQYYAGERSL